MQEKSTCSMCPKPTAHASCGDRRRGPSVRRCKWIWRQILCVWGRNSSSTRRRLPGPILRDHSRLRPKGPRRHTVDVMQETIWRNAGWKEGVCPLVLTACRTVCVGVQGNSIPNCFLRQTFSYLIDFFLRQASQPPEKLFFPSLLWLMTRGGAYDLCILTLCICDSQILTTALCIGLRQYFISCIHPVQRWATTRQMTDNIF